MFNSNSSAFDFAKINNGSRPAVKMSNSSMAIFQIALFHEV